MNIKRISGLAGLLSLLLAGSLLLAACGGGNTKETEAPTDAPATEAPEQETQNETETEAPAMVDGTFTVADQDGTVLSGVTLSLIPAGGSTDATSVTTDETGKFVATLQEGIYSVSYELLPEGYLADTTSVRIVKDTTAYELKVVNNVPNGSADRPFVIVDETTTVSIPAGASYVYVTFGAMERSFIMTNAALTVSYRDTEYTPDGDGLIKFPLLSESPRDPAYITLKNTGDTDVEATFKLEADPGTLNNPYVVENLGEAITATVPKEHTVYYKWVATKTGVLMVSSDHPKNYISMTNLTTSVNSYFTAGTFCEYIAVAEGDEVQIAVACTDSAVAVSEVSFTLTAYAGTAEDPIPVCKPAASFTLKGGQSRVFSYTGDATLMTVRGKSLRVVCGDQSVDADANDQVQLDIDASSEAVVFTLSNTGDDNQEYHLEFSQKSAS